MLTTWTHPILVCKECGDDGICDRCYNMDKRCRNVAHVLSRYVVYKGEKNISRPFTEKDRCQFCKEQLGNGVFYCKSMDHSQLRRPWASNIVTGRLREM